MVLLILFLFCLFITLIVGGLAAVSDMRSMTIPNRYSVYMLAVFCIAWGALFLGGRADVFGSVISHLFSAGLVFVVTAILFALKVIGGGDAKFATACSVWVGVKYVPVFLFFMTLGGGLLGAVALYIKRRKPFLSPADGSWIAQVQGGADKVPYGVAITFGMIVAFVYAGYFSPVLLSSFVVLQEGVLRS